MRLNKAHVHQAWTAKGNFPPEPGSCLRKTDIYELQNHWNRFWDILGWLGNKYLAKSFKPRVPSLFWSKIFIWRSGDENKWFTKKKGKLSVTFVLISWEHLRLLNQPRLDSVHRVKQFHPNRNIHFLKSTCRKGLNTKPKISLDVILTKLVPWGNVFNIKQIDVNIYIPCLKINDTKWFSFLFFYVWEVPAIKADFPTMVSVYSSSFSEDTSLWCFLNRSPRKAYGGKAAYNSG